MRQKDVKRIGGTAKNFFGFISNKTSHFPTLLVIEIMQLLVLVIAKIKN